MDRTSKIIIGLLSAVLILNWFSYGRLNRAISELKEENGRMRNEVVQVTNNVQSAVSSQVERFLGESQSNIDFYAVKYESIDIDNRIAGVRLNFSLKSSENIEKVKVGFTADESAELTELYAEAENGIHYIVNTDLSYLSNYSANIYATTKDGGIKKLNTEPIYCGLKDELNNRTQISDIRLGHNNDGTDFGFSLENNTFGYDALKIQSVKVEVSHDSIDMALTVTPQPFENQQTFNQAFDNAKFSYSSENGSKSVDEARKESYSQQLKNEYETRYFIAKVSYSELGIKIKGNPRLRYNVIITYQNGEKAELQY